MHALGSPSLRFTNHFETGVPYAETCCDRKIASIKMMFNDLNLTISAYDTAWVAMIPYPGNMNYPCFPQCLNWLLENQHCDGSWGLRCSSSYFLKDSISSTLASVLALKLWNIGEGLVDKGLRFIELNYVPSKDAKQLNPLGFDIIFPGMIELAREMDVHVPIRTEDIDSMLLKRDLEIRSLQKVNSEGAKAQMAHVSEGLGKLQDWEMVMQFQRKNGSLFNSPSSTASASIHLQNERCLNYVASAIDAHRNAVPTLHPSTIYTRLFMIDSLQNLGIRRHFKREIKAVLDETHRYWLQIDEEIFSDLPTRALAFRMLRTNGYHVSSDAISKKLDHTNPTEMRAALELYRSTELAYPTEAAVERTNLELHQYLKQEASHVLTRTDDHSRQEVEDALNLPHYATLHRVKTKKTIEHYCVHGRRFLKTSYWSSAFGNRDFLDLAMEDYNFSQSLHLQELQYLQRWVEDSRLHELKFARQKLTYCYFSAASTLPSPEHSMARLTWTKNGILTTVVDDFFDTEATDEELSNLIQLIERWDSGDGGQCCSEKVEIIFSAIRRAVREIVDAAFCRQSRDVAEHVVGIWVDLLRSMMREVEWRRVKAVPTLDEYMENARTSFALGPIVVPSLYFIGPKLSSLDFQCAEFRSLFELMSTCGRLLNDIHGFEREGREGKLNAVHLRVVRGGSADEREAVEEMRSQVGDSRKKLMRLVFSNGGGIPRECRELFWNMCKVLHFFYEADDGFTSQRITDIARSVMLDPLARPILYDKAC